jgi:hypothetical protein
MVYVPLASLLAQSGLQLDIVTANAEVKQWLREVANQLVHGTTYEQPPERMTKEVPPSACAAGAIAGAISLPQAAGGGASATGTTPATVTEHIAEAVRTAHELHAIV